jgi:nicotinamide-nucleotide amidase
MQAFMQEDVLVVLALQIGELLERLGLKLVTAESCTGGWVSMAITSIAGCSAWFERGFVTYSNESKQDMLGVSGQSLATHGAVSEQVAVEMALGALKYSHGNISLSVSGLAGPGGGSLEKPVGTVCFAWAKDGKILARETQHFSGDRHQIRLAAVHHALSQLYSLLV